LGIFFIKKGKRRCWLLPYASKVFYMILFAAGFGFDYAKKRTPLALLITILFPPPVGSFSIGSYRAVYYLPGKDVRMIRTDTQPDFPVFLYP
jgi:hypothetical protein